MVVPRVTPHMTTTGTPSQAFPVADVLFQALEQRRDEQGDLLYLPHPLGGEPILLRALQGAARTAITEWYDELQEAISAAKLDPIVGATSMTRDVLPMGQVGGGLVKATPLSKLQ